LKISKPRPAKKAKIQNSKPQPSEARAGDWFWVEVAIPLALFLFAFTVRLVYLFQIERVPLFYYPVGDARAYDEWAQRIAAGAWWGQGVFYQAPLYPYFLGLLQFVLGHDLWWIRIVQITLGASSCVLLYWAGRFFFSQGTGIAAGLILALYAPGIFFDGLIQKTVLDLFLISLLLFLLSRTQSRSHWSQWGVIGAVLGLLALTRENALIWALVVPVWIWLRFSAESLRSRFRWVFLFLLGLILVLFPVGLRNQVAGGEFTLTTSQLGPNFFIGNNPGADGTYAPLRAGHGDPQFERRDATDLAEQALGRSLSPGEVSRYWLRRAWDYISSQPIDWLRLLGKKWLLVWNVRELEDAEDFYLYQKWSWLLSLLGSMNHFGVLMPLAALGMILSWRQWRRFWLLYALLASLAMSIVAFFILGRYRFSLVPLLVLFAGAGLERAFDLYKKRNVWEGAAVGLPVLLVAVLVNWPIFGWPAPSAAGYHNVGNALFKQGKVDQAIENYQEALKILPTYASAHYSLGNSFAQLGRFDSAILHYREAIRLNPDFAEAYNNVGNVLGLRGDLEGAIQQFRKALELSPNSGEIHLNLGNALARKGLLDEAIGQFQQALNIRPDSAQLHYSLGKALAAQGRLHQAADQFREALRVQADFAPARQGLRQLLAEQDKQKR
jgi:tetratricopeptide (TPR) repeat protein